MAERYKEGRNYEATVTYGGEEFPNPGSYAYATAVTLVGTSLDLHVEAGRILETESIKGLALTLRWICDRVQVTYLMPEGVDHPDMMASSHKSVRAAVYKAIHSLKADIGGAPCRIPWGGTDADWKAWADRVETRAGFIVQMGGEVLEADLVGDTPPWVGLLTPDPDAG